MFLIYINDLPEGISTNAKLFADDASLFFVIHDNRISANDFNKDLEMIHNGTFQWKINFNPVQPLLNKLRNSFLVVTQKKLAHPPLVFDNAIVNESIYQKNLGIILDFKLTIENHLKMVNTKINKTIGLLRKLQNLSPRTALITVYKAFVRPHLDHGYILFDQAFDLSFHQKLESIQYRACLAVTGEIPGIPREKI